MVWIEIQRSLMSYKEVNIFIISLFDKKINK
jgi:hypothetical protein